MLGPAGFPPLILGATPRERQAKPESVCSRKVTLELRAPGLLACEERQRLDGASGLVFSLGVGWGRQWPPGGGGRGEEAQGGPLTL